MPIALMAYVRIAMTVHDIYANSAHDIQHKGQAALWVTNGCTSVSKPITTWAMGVDNQSVLPSVCTLKRNRNAILFNGMYMEYCLK